MEGPLSYRNWGEYLAGRPETGIVEYPLFSDARVGGEITDLDGPYELLNALNFSTHSRGPAVQYPVLILRGANHMPSHWPRTDWTKTSANSYHGGGAEDEIAALLSLALGVRMMAGGPTRVFDPGMDSRGRPQYLYTNRDPILPRGRSGN